MFHDTLPKGILAPALCGMLVWSNQRHKYPSGNLKEGTIKVTIDAEHEHDDLLPLLVQALARNFLGSNKLFLIDSMSSDYDLFNVTT